jgi:FMN phosphatase YigB (HAD superfamily)
MDDCVIIMDVGDVLIRTFPGAHYRALAQDAGADWRDVGRVIEESGLPAEFEAGRLGAAEFAAALRAALGSPALPDHRLERAWRQIIGEADPQLAPLAAALAADDRLLLASNTNVWHWPTVCRRLAAAGIRAPACLSFEAGFVKPDPGFFRVLTRRYLGASRCMAYIDDRADNVAAAAELGLRGWQHLTPARTAAQLAGLPWPR